MLKDERKLTLTQAAAICPTRPHMSAVWRWARKGIKTAAGRRVRLEHIRIGHRICTTQAALDEFVRSLTDLANQTERTETDERNRKELCVP